MKTSHFFLFIFVFSCFSVFAAKKPNPKSIYLQQLPAANTGGSLLEFQAVDKGKAFAKMFHNDESVQIQIAVSDENMQTKFLMQGLKVYIDIAGKKSQKYCIEFPKLEREQMMGNMQQGQGQQGTERSGRMNMNQMIMMMNLNNAVFVSNKNKILLEKEQAGVQFSEEDYLLFTVYLPISLVGEKIGKNRVISVGLSAEMEASEMSPGGGMGGPGGGGMRAGGGGGGLSGGAMRVGGGPGGGGGSRPTGGSAFSEMVTRFNQWIVFDLE